jgi:hypothetical protein
MLRRGKSADRPASRARRAWPSATAGARSDAGRGAGRDAGDARSPVPVPTLRRGDRGHSPRRASRPPLRRGRHRAGAPSFRSRSSGRGHSARDRGLWRDGLVADAAPMGPCWRTGAALGLCPGQPVRLEAPASRRAHRHDPRRVRPRDGGRVARHPRVRRRHARCVRGSPHPVPSPVPSTAMDRCPARASPVVSASALDPGAERTFRWTN